MQELLQELDADFYREARLHIARVEHEHYAEGARYLLTLKEGPKSPSDPTAIRTAARILLLRLYILDKQVRLQNVIVRLADVRLINSFEPGYWGLK